MLHGMIKVQGHCLNVRDDISEKMNILHIFQINLYFPILG